MIIKKIISSENVLEDIRKAFIENPHTLIYISCEFIAKLQQSSHAFSKKDSFPKEIELGNKRAIYAVKTDNNKYSGHETDKIIFIEESVNIRKIIYFKSDFVDFNTSLGKDAYTPDNDITEQIVYII